MAKKEKKFFTGFIVARQLYDDDGKLKSFAFYPRKLHGKPPYHYKTRVKAERAKQRLLKDSFYQNEGLRIVKFTKHSYLDRF